MSKEAMTLALEALNKLTDAAGGFSVSGVYFNEGVWEQECLNAAYDAIKALEEALAKQEQGEPVMGMLEPIGILMKLEGDKHMKIYGMDEQLEQQPVATDENWDGTLYKGIIHSEKLITPQPAQKPWVGLTDADKQTAVWSDGSFGSGALWAEAKLKEKNT